MSVRYYIHVASGKKYISTGRRSRGAEKGADYEALCKIQERGQPQVGLLGDINIPGLLSTPTVLL